MPAPAAFGLRRADVKDPDAPFGRDKKGDPKAPFGLRADGGVRLRPGRTLGGGKKGAEPKRPARPKGRRSTGSSSRSPAPPKRKADYTEGIRLVGENVVELLTVAGVAKDEIYLADAAVAAQMIEPVAEGLNELADNVPWLAMGLERLNQVAPYTGIAAALSAGVAQLVANHVPRLRDLLIARGLATEPRTLIAGVKLAQARKLAAAAQEAAEAEAQAEQAMAAAAAAWGRPGGDLRDTMSAAYPVDDSYDRAGASGPPSPPPTPLDDRAAVDPTEPYPAAGDAEAAELDALYGNGNGAAVVDLGGENQNSS